MTEGGMGRNIRRQTRHLTEKKRSPRQWERHHLFLFYFLSLSLFLSVSVSLSSSVVAHRQEKEKQQAKSEQKTAAGVFDVFVRWISLDAIDRRPPLNVGAKKFGRASRCSLPQRRREVVDLALVLHRNAVPRKGELNPHLQRSLS